jgi:hypothetical protein
VIGRVKRPTQLIGQAFSECARHWRRYRISDLPILLQSGNPIRPSEIVRKALQTRTFAYSYYTMVFVMNRPKRTKIAGACTKRVRRAFGMETVVE